MTNLYLIRHGEAVVNVKPVIGGMLGDTGLTARGRIQAERLRDRLAHTKEIAADVFISSTLPRARETAEIIAPSIGLPITLDDEVQELRVGEADGLTIEEMWERYGSPNFTRNPFQGIAPGAEGWAQFMVRVGRALHRIIREHAGKTVVIVCHGGVIDGSFFYFFGLNSLAGPDVGFYAQNTSITRWQYHTNYVGEQRWRLLCYNDICHLRNEELIGPDHVRWEREPAEDDLQGSGTHQAVPLPTE